MAVGLAVIYELEELRPEVDTRKTNWYTVA